MSNAMRSGKRVLAGVAAGALALGMLTIASAPAASAKPNVKPKASLTGTVSPVRATFVGAQLEAVPFSQITWTSNGTLTGSTDTIAVTLTSAPSPTAALAIGQPTLVGVATTPDTSNAITNATANETLATGATSFVTNTGVTAGNTARIAIAATQAGTYTGSITTNSAANCNVTTGGQTGGGVCDVVAFTFTTTGKATSMTLTPATQTTSTSGTAPVVVTIKDAAGNVTQPLVVDTVTMSAPGASGITPITMTTTGPTPATSSLFAGTALSTFTASTTPGTYTVTATPAGTLPSAGVTAQNATVVVSGTITETPVSTVAVTVPDNAFVDTACTGQGGTYNVLTNACWDVPSGTTATTIRVTGTVGATYRFAATTSALGTVDGVGTAAQPVFKSVTIGADGRGTMAFTIGGNASVNGGLLTVSQVGANGSAITGGTVPKVVVEQALPSIPADGSTIYVTPYGSVVAALGSTVKVSILVTDQFGTPVANSAVRAFRNTTSGALLSSGVTNASGTAELSVSGAAGIASGTTESYVFTATTNAGTTVTATGLFGTLSVQYTTSGAVTSMTVLVSGGAQTPILNTTTAIATQPFIQVPYLGTVDTPASGVYTVATGGGTAAGNYATFTPSTSPANTVTVTVPEGVKVTEYNPANYTIGWNSALASQSISVASTQPVYVFATKTGTFDVTFTSGAITSTAKVRVTTVPQAAYNISLSPAKQSIEQNAFSNITLKVTDAFGNPVPGATGANGGTLVTVTGEALLGGTTNAATPTTGADGAAVLTVIAGRPGTASFKAVPLTGQTAGSPWSSTFVKPTGFPDPVKEATAEAIITSTAARSIAIVGERATVSGKPGIRVEGIADNFANGAKVKPWVRFPGETAYSEGSARPEVTDEEFTWQRKTGKKVYVYFTSEDGAIQSNRVIIPAK